MNRILITGSLLFFTSICHFAFTQTDIRSQNGGSMSSATDDFIIFNLNPTPPVPTYTAPYTYTLTATQNGNPVSVTFSNGASADTAPYGISSPFRTGSGTAGMGNIILTVTPNFGAATPQQYTLNDPGSSAVTGCSSGEKTVTYKYTAPLMLTDAEGENTYIPKFIPTSGQTLTKVDITMKAVVLSSQLLENSASQSQKFKATFNEDIAFALNGSDLPLTNNIGQLFSQSITLPAAVSVPASGAWLGDVDGSTIKRMMQDGWLSSRAFAYLNPTTDNRWVTNVTGNPGNDADIFKNLGNVHTAINSASFDAPADLVNFTGTSGNIPLTYSTLGGMGLSGGGGNVLVTQFTQTYFEVEVTYTYNQTCITTLPVKLEKFEAQKAEGGVQLKWTVAGEENFDHYEIQHSYNALNFNTIGSVQGEDKNQYNFFHTQTSAGDQYYRLKSVDLDGTFSLSRIVKVTVEGNDGKSIFPNPARTSELVFVPLNPLRVMNSVEVIDMSGRIIKTLKATEAQNGISISSLRAGRYMVRIVGLTGPSDVRKLVVSE